MRFKNLSVIFVLFIYFTGLIPISYGENAVSDAVNDAGSFFQEAFDDTIGSAWDHLADEANRFGSRVSKEWHRVDDNVDLEAVLIGAVVAAAIVVTGGFALGAFTTTAVTGGAVSSAAATSAAMALGGIGGSGLGAALAGVAMTTTTTLSMGAAAIAAGTAAAAGAIVGGAISQQAAFAAAAQASVLSGTTLTLLPGASVLAAAGISGAVGAVALGYGNQIMAHLSGECDEVSSIIWCKKDSDLKCCDNPLGGSCVGDFTVEESQDGTRVSYCMGNSTVFQIEAKSRACSNSYSKAAQAARLICKGSSGVPIT